MFAKSRRILPTYYQLGLWRTEYLNQFCCVCQVNPSVVISIAQQDTATYFNQKPALRRRAWVRRGSLLCARCHYQIDWLPPITHLDIPALSLRPPSKPLNSTLFNSQPFNLKPSDSHSANGKISKSALPAPSRPNNLSTVSILLPTSEPPLLPNKQLSVQAATRYNDTIRAAIIAFKYKEDMTALPLLVHALRQLPRPKGHHRNNSVLLSVPTTNHRLKKRGFDPVTILSYYLSLHWNISLWNGISRIDDAVSQQGLSRQERQQNIRNAFQLDALPPKRRIILFDDVVTTGTTLKELASCFNSKDTSLFLSAYAVAYVG